MNIYELLNSRSIAQHWVEIDYHPDSLETAWLVYFSRKLTFKEKCKCWEEIIETMPDMEIPERANCRHYDSLHRFLREFMIICRRYLDWFYDNTDCVYSLKEFDNGYRYDNDYRYENAFSTVDAVKEFADNAGNGYAVKFEICKMIVDDFREDPACIVVNKEFEPMMPENWQYGAFTIREDEYDILSSFEGMGFNFPVPFKKGDILFNPNDCDPHWSQYSIDGRHIKLFVFDSLSPYNETFPEGRADMCFQGTLLLRSSIHTCSYSGGCYMDYEFYNGEFRGRLRILKAISDYKKGIIDKEKLNITFVNAYNSVVDDERAMGILY